MEGNGSPIDPRRNTELQSISQTVPDICFVLDPDGTVRDYRPGDPADLHVLAAHFLGKRGEDVLPEEVGRALRKAVAEVLRTDLPVAVEYSLLLPQGERQFEARLLPFPDRKIVAAIRNVTAEKRAEEALRASEKRYRTLVEAVDDGMHVKDRKGRYLLVNSEMARRLGMAKEEIVGRTAKELYSPEEARQVMETDSQVLKTGTVLEIDEEHVSAGGTRIHHVRKMPLRSEAGEVVGVVTVSRDITERKQLEEQLLRAQRLETAGQVASQVAHDFKNLLSPLVAFPELIKMDIPEDSPIAGYLDVMLESARRMAEINDNLLALGRRGHIVMRPTNLNAVVEQATAQMADRPPSLMVECLLDPDLLSVKGSPAQLLRMVSNLISNAREAMQDAGLLALKTENIFVEESLGRYSRIKCGEYVRLVVADTGCGIPAEIQDRIFDVFFTTKRTDQKRGSGLGLSIVQAIVDDHKGYLDLESRPGEGTSFSIYLPVSREPLGEKPRDEVRGGTESLLVVDDDPLQLQVMGNLLGRLGYRIDAVTSGKAALDYLRDHAPDLLILDMIMPPEMDGVETYRRALKLRPGQRAIVVSGFAQSERVEEVRALGVGAFVSKPVTMEALARAVRAELDR